MLAHTYMYMYICMCDVTATWPLLTEAQSNYCFYNTKYQTDLILMKGKIMDFDKWYNSTVQYSTVHVCKTINSSSN